MKAFWTFVLTVLMSCLSFTACSEYGQSSDGDNDASEYVSNHELESLRCYTDLHLHLDGSMTVEMIRELARVQNLELSYSDEELKDMLQVSDDCSDLNEYLAKFPFPLQFLQTREGLKKAVELLCMQLHECGVIYAEIRYAPQLHCDKGMSQRDAVEAAIEGTLDSPIPVTLILCCMRGDDNHDRNLETVNLAAEYLGKGVGAIDIAGAEALFPTENFADLFALAVQKNIPFTIHAGEAAGPESVYKALEYGTRRIGHGVRSAEDERLMEILKEKDVILEVCPTSNINTAIFSSIEDVPFRLFLDKGVRFTVNSDNMSVSATNVKEEFIALNSVFNIRRSELLQILNNSIDAAFTAEDEKTRLKDIIYTSVMNVSR